MKKSRSYRQLLIIRTYKRRKDNKKAAGTDNTLSANSGRFSCGCYLKYFVNNLSSYISRQANKSNRTDQLRAFTLKCQNYLRFINFDRKIQQIFSRLCNIILFIRQQLEVALFHHLLNTEHEMLVRNDDAKLILCKTNIS